MPIVAVRMGSRPILPVIFGTMLNLAVVTASIRVNRPQLFSFFIGFSFVVIPLNICGFLYRLNMKIDHPAVLSKIY